jgi:hemin uptake protein HemP
MNAKNGQDDQGIRDKSASSRPDGRRDVAMIDCRIESRDLFASTREVTIAHGGDVYRLRLTAQNKLILTK